MLRCARMDPGRPAGPARRVRAGPRGSHGPPGSAQAGTAGLAADGNDVLTIGDVPHAVLFPRLAAVVHHGGAGTSAAALRAGVPAVTVPVTADQPFWAGRLAAIGAATDPIPFRSLTAERLAASLHQVVRQQTHSRAAFVWGGEQADAIRVRAA